MASFAPSSFVRDSLYSACVMKVLVGTAMLYVRLLLLFLRLLLFVCARALVSLYPGATTLIRAKTSAQ